MKGISILGCGWLGLPLAKSLLEKGFSVKGSTTSLDKVAVLANAGIEAFQIEVSEEGIIGDASSFMENSEILIIDIPPKLRKDSAANFVKKISNLIPFMQKSFIQNVIFVSSTSVYADDNSEVTEKTIPEPETESGRQLVAAEKLLQNNADFKTTVIRFGGLIGEDRHPIFSLAGRKNISNPDSPINLIHQNDCIGIIQAIIEQDYWNDTFNAAAPFHPTRRDYYTQKATELSLPLPEFSEDTTSRGNELREAMQSATLRPVDAD